MKTFIARLHNALEYQLYNLFLTDISECERLKSAIKYSKKALRILKRYISCCFFENMEDEIWFFKHAKPSFYSKFIYYVNLYNFHIKKPTGSEEAIMEYIAVQLADLKRFFDRNQVFYQYYRSDSTHLDSIYFTRNCTDVYLEPEDFHGDDLFSTSHDYKLSKIIANKKFQEYLIDQTKKVSCETGANENPVVWTCNQTDLVELIYALKETGAINNGNIEIKSLIDYFEVVFKVDLKHYYRKYADMACRKKERTVFLDRLKTSLIRKMDSKYELEQPELKRITFR